jgi:hypothetical protein
MAVSRSWPITPIQLEGSADGGKQGYYVAQGEGERGIAGRHKTMAKRIQFVAVDVGDGARSAHAEIARQKLDADHRPRFEVGGVAHALILHAAGGDGLARFESQGAQLRREAFNGGAREPAKGQRRGDIDHAAFAGVHGCGPRNGFEEIAIEQRTDGPPAGRRTSRQRRSGAHHLLDRTDAADRILRIWERHRHGAHQLAIDVDRAAAHAFHDAGVLERAARKPRQDERLLGAEIVEHAQDFHLEFFHAIAGEDSPAGAFHARADVLQREKGGLSRQNSAEGDKQGNNRAEHHTIVQARCCGT